MRGAAFPAPPNRRIAGLARARVVLAVRRARGPAAAAARPGIAALVLLAEPVHLGRHGRLTGRVLARMRLAVPLGPGLLAAGIPDAGMLGAVLPPQAHGPIALRYGTGVLVAGCTIALDLAHVRAALLVSAHVVAAGHGAGLDGLVADDAARPSTGVFAAVGSLVAAGVEAAVGLAGMFFACVAVG